MTTEWRTTEMEERVMRFRRRMSFSASAVIVPYCLEDVFSGGANATRLILIKIFWGAALAAIGFSLPSASPASRRQLLTLVTFVCALAMSAIAFVRGGHHTAYFAWLIALPFCLVALAQDEVQATVVGSVTTFLGAALILFRADVTFPDKTQWLMCLATACGIAIYASIHQRRHLREEFVQNRGRVDALDRLAESEKLRAESQRMALVGQLAAGVAHEINNPLGSVSSNLEFLAGELALPTTSADERMLVMLETQLGLKRIKGIVADLNAFCRDGVENTTEVDLRDVVDEAEKIAAHRTHGRMGIVNELPRDLKRVIGNPAHLSQVFLNLMLNSADAFGSQRSDGRIWIRATQLGTGVQIEVDDNGPGFPDSVFASLFQPFFTTKGPGKGTGLGLATSREYLRRAGGDLRATPRPGGGARFTLALRAAP